MRCMNQDSLPQWNDKQQYEYHNQNKYKNKSNQSKS